MKNILFPIIFIMGIHSTAQVGIGTTTPNESSALDIASINSGILIPRMTLAQRDAITSPTGVPATGLMIFQTDNTPGFYYYEGGWKPFKADIKWIVSGDNIYNTNDGNIGVGTATPTTKLHVENAGSPPLILDQGFEAGLTPMTTSGDKVWSRPTTHPHTGRRSAKSGPIGSNQRSTIEYTATVPAGGASLSFWYKVSSVANYDMLKFYINNVERGVWSGEVGYSQYVETLPQGTYTLKWEYTKDGSLNSGQDAAFVDDVLITGAAPAAFRLVEGNQGFGKVIVSDANGNARWEQLSNSNIPDIPLIAAFGGMKIPICNSAYVGQSGIFPGTVNIKGVETTVSWEILKRVTSSGSTTTVNGVNVLKAPFDAERLQVKYTFSPELPFYPKGLIFSANNNSSENYPDTFTLNYASKSQSQITINITRNDKFGDTGSNCWMGQFYFDVFMTN